MLIFIGGLSCLLPTVAGATSLERAEKLFGEKKYDEAAKLFDSALQNAFITSKDKAYAQCRRGLILSLQGGFNQAREQLEPAVQSGSLSAELASTCSYALLQIYVLKNENQKAMDLIDQMGQPSFAPIYQARLWALGSDVAQRVGDTRKEVIFLERLVRVMQSLGIDRVELRILSSRVITLAEVLQRLGRPAPPAGPGSPASATANTEAKEISAKQASEGRQSLFQRLSLYMSKTIQMSERGRWQSAHKRWTLLEQKNLGGMIRRLSGFSPPLEAVAQRFAALQKFPADAIRVGLIVPDEFQLTSVSHQILRSASAFLASPASNGVQIETFVRAVRPDAGAVEKATLDLILQDHVHVIIGPVSAALTLGALRAIELFGVPLFALGPVSDAPGLRSPFVVRMGVLAESQSQELVRHGKEQGLRNVSIMAPNDAYGVEMARSFSRVAKQEELPIENVTFYQAGSEVFNEAVQHALGPQDPSVREEEYQALIRELKKSAREEKRKFDPSEVKLPALVRFDALFLPDSLQNARVISSTFAFHDAPSIRYLGDFQWANGDRRPSIADEFLNGSRIPVPAEGKYLNHLLVNLGITDPQYKLDIERQVFDALILIRQGHYLAKGLAGEELMRALKIKNWTVQGASQISGISDSGEPLTRFQLRSYARGALSTHLPDWKSGLTETSPTARETHSSQD